MKTSTRFIKSAIDSAETTIPPLPFQRGAGRAARLARRDTPPRLLRSA